MGASSSSLHEAVSEGNVKKLQRLLKKNAGKVNDAHNAGTLLLQAVKANNPEVVALLLKYKAKPNMISHIRTVATNPDSHFIYDWTAIHEAARQGGGESMELLLAHGGNKDLHAQNLMPPLHVAAWYHETEAVRTLIDAGCDVNQLDYLCESAMVIPICQGDTEMVQLLLTAGCKLNSRAWGNLRKISCYHQSRHESNTKPGPTSLLSLAIYFSWMHLAILILQHGFISNHYYVDAILRDIKQITPGRLPPIGRHLFCCYIATRSRFYNGDYSESKKRILPPNVCHFSEELIRWMQQMMLNARSLKEICRIVVRKQISKAMEWRSVIEPIKQMQLPSSIKAYLACEEFLDYPQNSTEQPTYLEQSARERQRHCIQFWRESCCFL